MSATPASDFLRADHRQIETHLDRLLDLLQHLGLERIPEIRQAFNTIRSLSEPHFVREETILYPYLRERLPDVLSIMEREHADTREFEGHLEEALDKAMESPGDRELSELRWFGLEFHDAVQVHIVDEEDRLLQVADAMLSREEQIRLRDDMEKAV